MVLQHRDGAETSQPARAALAGERWTSRRLLIRGLGTKGQEMKQRWRLSCSAALLTTIVTVTSAAASGPGTADRPNIVYILADDLGWKDVGFHGSDIKTPNIDGLAAQGTRLEQFYAQPMCTPTRAALMTGRYPLRYGLQTAVIPDAGMYG